MYCIIKSYKNIQQRRGYHQYNQNKKPRHNYGDGGGDMMISSGHHDNNGNSPDWKEEKNELLQKIQDLENKIRYLESRGCGGQGSSRHADWGNNNYRNNNRHYDDHRRNGGRWVWGNNNYNQQQYKL